MEDLYMSQYDENQYAVMSDAKIQRIQEMMSICNDLGLERSQEAGKSIPTPKLKSWCDAASKNHLRLREIFELRDRRKVKSDTLSFSQCVILLKSIFEAFGFTKVVKGKRKKIRVNGKEVEDPNVNYMIEEHVNGLVNWDDGEPRLVHGDLGLRIYHSFDLKRKVGKLNLLNKSCSIVKMCECENSNCCNPLNCVCFSCGET